MPEINLERFYMKKIIVSLLAFISVLNFTGCGNRNEGEASKEPAVSVQSQVSNDGSENAADENSYSEISEESIYISDDPNEYLKYLGQWLHVGSENCIMEITYPDDKHYSITIDCKAENFVTKWTLTGIFEAENGGIFYEGSMVEKMADETEQTKNDCSGYIRLGEDGLIKWRDSKDTRGKDFIFKRTDT